MFAHLQYYLSAVCLWGREGSDSISFLNGEYNYVGEYNAAPYYIKYLDDSWSDYNQTYLWKWRGDDCYVFTGTEPGAGGLSLTYAAKCDFATEYPADCGSNWAFPSNRGLEIDVNVAVTEESCPALDCDSISTSISYAQCDGPFDQKIGVNAWSNTKSTVPRYFYFVNEAFAWVCTDEYVMVENGVTALYAYSEDSWYNLDIGQSVNVWFEQPEIAQYTISCIGNAPTPIPTTISPTLSPTPMPSFPTIKPTKATALPTSAPTSSPSQNPSKSPSESPSKSPSKSPSENPSESPSISPTAYPTTIPTTKPSTVPTVFPIKTTGESSTGFGVTVLIVLQLNMNITQNFSSINTRNLLTNITNIVIDGIIPIIDDHNDCISSGDYNTTVVISDTGLVIILARVTACDQGSQEELSVAFDANLETDFIDQVDGLDGTSKLYVEPQSYLQFTVSKIHEAEAVENHITTTLNNRVSGDQTKNDWISSLFLFPNVLMIGAAIFILLLCMISLYFCVRTKTVRKGTNKLAEGRSGNPYRNKKRFLSAVAAADFKSFKTFKTFKPVMVPASSSSNIFADQMTPSGIGPMTPTMTGEVAHIEMPEIELQEQDKEDSDDDLYDQDLLDRHVTPLTPAGPGSVTSDGPSLPQRMSSLGLSGYTTPDPSPDIKDKHMDAILEEK